MKPNESIDPPLIRSIRLKNLLSFGPEAPPLEMERLNILIGPNGAGKSNVIEALALMRATPIPAQATSNSDVRGVVRRGGGVHEWIWKGASEQSVSIELVFNYPKNELPLRHAFVFRSDAQGFRLHDERVEDQTSNEDQAKASFYYRFEAGNPIVNAVVAKEGTPSLLFQDSQSNRGEVLRRKGFLRPADMNFELSILSQRRDPERFPELSYLADSYEKIRIYREWAFGRNTIFREPQKADMRNDRLEEDFSNLGLFLSRLRKNPKTKKAIVEGLAHLYEGLTDFEPFVEGGTVQVVFTEGDYSISATRLSDGTLRYLCLLAILCDPTPPPLICIEEPELGLHPDILPQLADLLVTASQRTQLIITTHSDILVDAMTERPETVVICEKHGGKTEMHRLKKDDLTKWLEKYRLGQLWIDGQLGGKRW